MVAILALLGSIGFAVIYYQGKKDPVGDPHYVAMGSSFAAGIGLGARAPNSPALCMRTVNGYPDLLAKRLEVPLLDVSCSAATTGDVLEGGQFFQSSQVSAVTADTKLVTITSGGNDIRYVGDLSFAAAKRDDSLYGWLARQFLEEPLVLDDRDFDKVRHDLGKLVSQIRRRAPDARIVLVTYPMILPPTGNCSRLNISDEQADLFRSVGEQLAAATRAAANDSGALLADIQRLGAGHHACSENRWVEGWNDNESTPFHPTVAGAQAMAAAIETTLKSQNQNTDELSDNGVE